MAAVVAHAFVLVSEYVPGAKQAGNAVGKLDFAADAYSGLAQMLEYFGLQHITPHNGACRGGVFRRGFFHTAIQPGGAAVYLPPCSNPVFSCLVLFHLLDGHHSTVVPARGAAQL